MMILQLARKTALHQEEMTMVHHRIDFFHLIWHYMCLTGCMPEVFWCWCVSYHAFLWLLVEFWSESHFLLSSISLLKRFMSYLSLTNAFFSKLLSEKDGELTFVFFLKFDHHFKGWTRWVDSTVSCYLQIFVNSVVHLFKKSVIQIDCNASVLRTEFGNLVLSNKMLGRKTWTFCDNCLISMVDLHK